MFVLPLLRTLLSLFVKFSSKVLIVGPLVGTGVDLPETLNFLMDYGRPFVI